jgi:hypothetical protein
MFKALALAAAAAVAAVAAHLKNKPNKRLRVVRARLPPSSGVGSIASYVTSFWPTLCIVPHSARRSDPLPL